MCIMFAGNQSSIKPLGNVTGQALTPYFSVSWSRQFAGNVGGESKHAEASERERVGGRGKKGGRNRL